MLYGAVALLVAAALATGDGTSASNTPRNVALTMSLLILGVAVWLLVRFRVWKIIIIVLLVVGGFADMVYGVIRLDDSGRSSELIGLVLGATAAATVFVGALWSGVTERPKPRIVAPPETSTPRTRSALTIGASLARFDPMPTLDQPAGCVPLARPSSRGIVANGADLAGLQRPECTPQRPDQH